MLTEVEVESTDVTGSVIKWEHEDTWGEGIDALEISFSGTVLDVVTLTNGDQITVKRGFSAADDEFIFDGIITSIRPNSGIIECTCKGLLIECIKASRTTSFDKDIDTEAGVASEIIKNYITDSGLSYSSASIISTGTNEVDKIIKLIQNDEDDYTIMQQIADDYNYIIRRKPSDGLVYFEPKGYTTYPDALEVGKNIMGKLKWDEDIEELCNKVIVNGATVYDKVIETFAGAATTFTLAKTPEDTEVHINRATTDDLQTRGQKDVGTLGTDFDYYVDTDQKKITFSASVSDVWVNYGAQVPMPVVLKNTTSIDTYGGPNTTPSVKKFTYSDIIDVADAERRGRAYLAKFSTPFNSTEILVADTQIQIQAFEPGNLIQVIDVQNNKNLNVFVREIIKRWPHTGDKLIVGDKIWRTEDWQTDQQKQLDRIFNELNKNQDILISIFDFDRDVKFERRYMKKSGLTRDGGFILGNKSFDVLATNTLGRSITDDTVDYLRQGGNVYKEFFYDTDFDGTGTATWDTGNKELSFTAAQARITDLFSIGVAHSFFTVEVAAQTGSLLIEITGDDGANYETVTLDTRTAFAVSTTAGVKLRITENGASTAKLENTYDTFGAYNEPGIKVTLED